MFPKKFKTQKSNRQSTGQKELFQRIWNTRVHKCYLCSEYIPEMKSFCFAHILSKWRYPEYKFEENNIALVCSQDCHKKLDSINAHRDHEIIQELWLK
jgi:hypothetical protein